MLTKNVVTNLSHGCIFIASKKFTSNDFCLLNLLGLWPWASAETLTHNMSIIIQQQCLHTKPLIFLELCGHIIWWREEKIPVLASDRWFQVFNSFSFNVRVSLVKLQPVLILFCPFCSLSPLPSSAPSPAPAISTSLEGISLLNSPYSPSNCSNHGGWIMCGCLALLLQNGEGKFRFGHPWYKQKELSWLLPCLLAGASSLFLLIFAAFSFSPAAALWFSVTGLKTACDDSAFDKTFCS